jgi:hypothetical protein
MEPHDIKLESAAVPSVLAILAGGGAVAWMLYQNGFQMLRHWFFYPSIFLLVITGISLIRGIHPRLRRFAWTLCMWWSGLWTLVFFVAFVAPPFSTLMVASLVEPILEAGHIGSFSAGFLHLFLWACATDVMKHLNTEAAERPGTGQLAIPPVEKPEGGDRSQP